MYPVYLNKRLYKNRKTVGFNIIIMKYNTTTTRCDIRVINILKDDIIKKLIHNEFLPINFVLWKNGVIAANKCTNAQYIIKETAVKMRKFLELQYGTGTNLCGHCIEASEYMETILRQYGLKDVKQIEGYCLWEDEEYGSDRPYDEHTWLELGGKYYLDITADQFNPGFFEKDYFKPIEFRSKTPKEMRKAEPIAGEDYWLEY